MIERPWTEPYYSVASDPQRFEDGLKVHNDKPAKVKKKFITVIRMKKLEGPNHLGKFPAALGIFQKKSSQVDG